MKYYFKTYYGRVINDIGGYINDFIKENNNNVDVLIGCDSQSFKDKKTKYCVSIILYVRGHGGHVIYTSETTPIEKNVKVKIINEVWKSLSIAEYLKELGLKAPKYIDIDVNPNPKYGSNVSFKQAVGMVEGMGYKARYKHCGAIANFTCDHIVRS